MNRQGLHHHRRRVPRRQQRASRLTTATRVGHHQLGMRAPYARPRRRRLVDRPNQGPRHPLQQRRPVTIINTSLRRTDNTVRRLHPSIYVGKRRVSIKVVHASHRRQPQHIIRRVSQGVTRRTVSDD